MNIVTGRVCIKLQLCAVMAAVHLKYCRLRCKRQRKLTVQIWQDISLLHTLSTGKSVSEALILQSVNPQYNDRLFIDSWLQYKKNTTSEHVVYKHCFLFLFWSSKQCLYTTCSQLVFFLYWIQEWMNNLSSYCGLTDSRISASEKDLPVQVWEI